ncbi:MAG: DUF3182 family protein [Pseudoxanthomonas sp.]|nr:DUF3182 family protein [Pseudoxanthomonas sp.]
MFTLCNSTQPRSRHERASQAWVAQRLASTLGWRFGGEHGQRRSPVRPYFVPDETLVADQAARLGIDSEDDLFGGVVPHPFVASKVITHPLPSPDTAAPEGWSHGLSTALADAVLPGFSVFDPAAIEPAGQRLLALGGALRLKEPQARGGLGQYRVANLEALRSLAATLEPDAVRRDGIVLELNLEHATTCSVGEIRVGGRRLAYLGVQRQAGDRRGNPVYAGSSLRVVRGGLDALQAVASGAAEREALRCARIYDAAVAAAWPGFFASRRNYDVLSGLDAQGRWRCGVLEQSWRLGGASPAEIIALAAFEQAGAAQALEVSCHESHDPAHLAPAAAQVHFHDPSATHGPLLKYAQLEDPHGHPA